MQTGIRELVLTAGKIRKNSQPLRRRPSRCSTTSHVRIGTRGRCIGATGGGRPVGGGGRVERCTLAGRGGRIDGRWIDEIRIGALVPLQRLARGRVLPGHGDQPIRNSLVRRDQRQTKANVSLSPKVRGTGHYKSPVLLANAEQSVRFPTKGALSHYFLCNGTPSTLRNTRRLWRHAKVNPRGYSPCGSPRRGGRSRSVEIRRRPAATSRRSGPLESSLPSEARDRPETQSRPCSTHR
jgi:hypothetical protein